MFSNLVALLRSLCPRVTITSATVAAEDGDEVAATSTTTTTPDNAAAATQRAAFVEVGDGMEERELLALMGAHMVHMRPQDFDDGEQHHPSGERSLTAGKKQALIQGLNYRGGAYPLEGCINDADNMQRLFTQTCGAEAFLTMTDNTRLRPTRANMLMSYKHMIKRLHDHPEITTFFYHISSHGIQVPDRNGDEADGMDEALAPLDYNTAGLILDDLFRTEFVEKIPKGVRCICVFDACHSKSLADLRYSFAADQATNKIVANKPSRNYSLPVNVITISGCQDDQTSADVRPGPGQAFGALTSNLTSVIRRHKGQLTWRTLMLETDLAMRGFTQIPQLSSEQELDLDEMIDW